MHSVRIAIEDVDENDLDNVSSSSCSTIQGNCSQITESKHIPLSMEIRPSAAGSNQQLDDDNSSSSSSSSSNSNSSHSSNSDNETLCAPWPNSIHTTVQPTPPSHLSPLQYIRHTFSHRRDSESSVCRLPSNLSLPPTYKLYSDNDTGYQQLRQEMNQLARLEAFYRSNPGTVIHEFMWGDPITGERNVTWKDMCTTCFMLQFTGFYMMFWLLVLGFVGCVSFFTGRVPGPILLLWLPVFVFLIGVFYAQRQKQYRLQQLEELERQVQDSRERQVVEIDERRHRHNNHYFVIHNAKDHAHAVVTLLPPPPAYSPAERMEATVPT